MSNTFRRKVFLLGAALLAVLTCSEAPIYPTRCTSECKCDRRMKSADCSRKGLTSVPSLLPDTLERLQLSGNSFTVIKSSSYITFVNLKILYLQNNDIHSIEPNAFRNLYNLERLVLQRNRLERIESHFFHHLVDLRILDLTSNKIKSIDPDAFKLLPRISNINLRSNPLNCDCRTVGLQHWHDQHQRRTGLVALEEARCSNYRNRKLSQSISKITPSCSPRSLPGGSTLSCPACIDSTSLSACQQNQVTCPHTKEACHVQVRIIQGRQPVYTSLCATTETCARSVPGNMRTCSDPLDLHCRFCCASANCVGPKLFQGTPLESDTVYNTELDIELPNDGSLPYLDDIKREVAAELESVIAPLSSPPCEVLITIARDQSPLRRVKCIGTINCKRPTSPVLELRDKMYLRITTANLRGELTMNLVPNSLRITLDDDFCTGRWFKTRGGRIWLPSAFPGRPTSTPCPENPEANITSECRTPSNSWANIDDSACISPSERTTELEKLAQEKVTNENVARITENLSNITSSGGNFSSREVSLVSETVLNTVSSKTVEINNITASNLLTSINEMMSVDSDVLIDSEASYKSSTNLVRSTELLGSKVQTASASPVKIARAQIAILASKPSEEDSLLFETTGRLEDELNEERISLRVNAGLEISPSTVASVRLPKSVVQERMGSSNVHFAIYNNARFFTAAEMAKNFTGPKRTPLDTYGQKRPSLPVNSRIVSAKVGRQDLNMLNETVTVVLKHIVQNSSKHLCVFWDFEQQTWSDKGCNVTRSSEGLTVCECDHLTNFALLMDIYGTAGSLSEGHKIALSFISYIGCGVSMCGLILTLLTYFCFRKLLRDNPAKILVNLCSALLGVIVAFILTTQPFIRGNTIACKIFAGTTHYFVLASMVWMSIEAFYMYIALVRVFHTYYSKFMLKCCLIGWGLPIIAVGITIGISRDNYGKQGEICWLSPLAFYAALLAPVTIILVLNCVAFALVMNQLRQMDSRPLEGTSRRASVISRLRGAISLMVLLGLSWVFAYLAIGSAGVIFHYLFAVFNSLQGLFIFVFYCLLKKEAQIAWLRCAGCESTGTNSASTSKGNSNPNRTRSTPSTPRAQGSKTLTSATTGSPNCAGSRADDDSWTPRVGRDSHAPHVTNRV